MKQNAFVALVLSATILFSCTKEDQSVTETKHSSTSAAIGFTNGANRTFIEAMKECISPALNCLPDVIVKPSNLTAFVAVIQNDGTASGIADFFNTDVGLEIADELGMTSEYLAIMQSGTHNVEMVISGSDPDITMFLFGSVEDLADGKPDYVVPAKS